MRLVKAGAKQPQLFKGTCSICGSEYEANRKELHVEQGDQRDPGEFAHENCTVCLGRHQKGHLILYPV